MILVRRIVTYPTPEGVAFVVMKRPLIGRERPVPIDEWTAGAPPDLVLPTGRLLAWLDDETAKRIGDDALVVPHPVIAALSDREASALGLPPPPPLQLHIQAQGTIDQPDFSVRYGFRELTGQPVLGAERLGSWLRIGNRRAHRLPEHMFLLIEAIEAFNEAKASDDAERWRRWTLVQERLPTRGSSCVSSDAYLTNFRILHGSAFSIDPETIGGAFDIDPVIIAGRPARSPDDVDEDGAGAHPLLTPVQHQHFVKKRFRQADRCRPRYTLEDGVYLVLDPAVQSALDVIRQVQRADAATRREFVRNPRTYLRNALADRFDEDLIEDVFVETAGYSDRVRDVGLWRPQVLPWVSRDAGNWFPDQPQRQTFGLAVGERLVPVTPEDLDQLRADVAEGRRRGDDHVTYAGEGIPITEETERALDELASRRVFAVEGGGVNPLPEAEVDEGETASIDGRQILVIEGNFDELGYQRRVPRRPDRGADEQPAGVRSTLKEHQREGLRWMKDAWRHGAPGVLLADDMGLGKTLQCLAFLEWLRRIQQRAGEARPFLIVAPTSLLENWIAEHEQHLNAPGIGEPLKIWGRGLAALRTGPRGAEIDLGRCVLDRVRLAGAAWLLTTYETLRDYQHSLATIRFAAAAFDEVQKIKNPGALVTHAAKAVNADFVIGLSGTPVENRLADLWSIMDRVHEGFLGDLKSFSARFEASDASPATTSELKAKIAEPSPELPPVMLRRMKSDHLPGLPEKCEHVRSRVMPDIQADAYAAAVDVARRHKKGDVLRALQGIRAVSLNPLGADEAQVRGFIGASARWQVTFDVLEEIAGQKEKALIFLETIDLQPVLAALIRSRFSLPDQPMIINGQVAGNQRQRRVNAFQKGAPGFDVIILGPRAAGLGLTLTAANHVIHLSRWWNPAVEDQCTDRVYRIGQDKPVYVHIPQAIWPQNAESSFDRRLHELLQRKRALSRDLLAPPAPTDSDARELYESSIIAA